ncbi:MAG: HD-GYP domain-containing protein [Thermoanaerobaculia bacterium]
MASDSTVLIVDDEESVREALRLVLAGDGYRLAFASDGLEGLEAATRLKPDLILLDVRMPGLDGFEVCRRLRADPAVAEVPVVIVTVLADRQSRLTAIEAGADEFLSRPFDWDEVRRRVRTILGLNRYRKLQDAYRELAEAYDETMAGWVRALDLRDHETEGHTQRVTDLTVRLARELGIGDEQLVHLRRGALLHDIGKIGVPDAILRKPGPLTDEERQIMCRHPAHAYEMLQSIEFLQPALDIPYCHHEHWDGQGFPRGLAGEAIPLAARIFAVVDVWDALRYERPYRAAWPRDRVREHLRSLAGSHLDPRVVEAFLDMEERACGAGEEVRVPARGLEAEA